MSVLKAVLYLFLIIVVLYFLVKIKQLLQDRKELIKIPGPETKNILGGSYVTFKTFREWAKLYYPIYTFTFLHYVIPNILHPDDFERILSNPKHIEKSVVYDVFHNWLGTGLPTSTGEKWLNRRRILTPAFHFNILQQFVEIFNKQTDDLVKTFGDLGNQVNVCVDNHIAQFTLKTLAETAMGTQLKFFNKRK
ncbi:hypothetical protein Zmor_011019 [Zophobas morio]|uniref:Cytochrome P450 n=1 Tax=Zophobas morio TaxID=2755281 RepID=A0AA38IL96_9CUCU|nr:hypothetical protein Zmor_011019 [Zophobas morio]